MSKLIDYMIEAKTLYMATVDGEKPAIRPIGGKPVLGEMGFVKLDDRIYFYTDNRKSMYKQMSANSSIAITFVVSAGFIRMTAKAVFDNNAEAKKIMLSENKSLTQLYKADDGFFEVYYLEEVDAYLYAKGQEPLRLN